MRIFNGKKESEQILLSLKKIISKEKLKPALAIILVGEDDSSKLYIKLKKKAAKKIGIKLHLFKFNKGEKEQKIVEKIKSLNNNSLIDGIIVQLPLPEKFNPNKIIRAIDPKKDVDGFKKSSSFQPVLPLAILSALKKSARNFKGKKILALVNSKVFGEKLKLFLKENKIKTDYLLAKKQFFWQNKENKDKLKKADILIVVLGRAGIIKGEMIKKGAILIDVGITKTGPKKVCGDIDQESVKNKAGFLTPVPGGIGPLTVVSLLKNVYLSAKKSFRN